MPGLQLLFVDDSEADHFLLTAAAEGLDTPVRIAHFQSPGALLAALETGGARADAIITDLNMPGTNGFELIQSIRNRADWCHLPIIVLTTSSALVDRVRAEALETDGYFVKPLSPSEMTRQLGEMLEIVRRRRPGVRG